MTLLVSAPAWSQLPSSETFDGLCGDYIVEGNPEIKFQASGGSLSENMKRASRHKLPLGYTLQGLGIALPYAVPVFEHAGRAVSLFSASATKTESAVPANKLTSDTGSKPRILVMEEGSQIASYFRSKYETELYSMTQNRQNTIPGIHLAEMFLPSGAAPKINDAFDYILAPHVWQVLNREKRAKFVQDAYRFLRPGGTLRMMIRVHDVDRVAPELNGLTEEAGAPRLFASVKKQIDEALGASSDYSMMLRVQKVSYQPKDADRDSFDLGIPDQTESFDALEPISRPALQALVVVRKPGDGWYEYALGH